MKRLAFIFVIVLATGCATHSEGNMSAGSLLMMQANKKIILPDGSEGWHMDCSGWANNWGRCITAMGERCPNGYDILISGQTDGQWTQVMPTSQPSLSPYTTSYYGYSVPHSKREMIGRCR